MIINQNLKNLEKEYKVSIWKYKKWIKLKWKEKILSRKNKRNKNILIQRLVKHHKAKIMILIDQSQQA